MENFESRNGKFGKGRQMHIPLIKYIAPLIGLCATAHVYALYIASTLDKAAQGQMIGVTDHNLLY